MEDIVSEHVGIDRLLTLHHRHPVEQPWLSVSISDHTNQLVVENCIVSSLVPQINTAMATIWLMCLASDRIRFKLI